VGDRHGARRRVLGRRDRAARRGLAGRRAGAAARLLLDGRYGLDALLTARTESLSTSATLATGGQVRVWSAVPHLADWALATLLWTGAGLLALWAAASRHGERRRA
jgi:hypothetical protein